MKSAKKDHQHYNKKNPHEQKTVRGSGFTYNEAKHPTDKSIPIDKADQDDIIKLPELGQKNRP